MINTKKISSLIKELEHAVNNGGFVSYHDELDALKALTALHDLYSSRDRLKDIFKCHTCGEVAE